jgi:hypothetical protein
MGWFGLFDQLRLRTSAGAERDPGAAMPGWALPGSQLRVTDRGLAALYRGLILAAGQDYRADMFDLAGHHLARSHAAGAGLFHIDARLTGRPQRILFGEDPAHGLIAWHEPSQTAQVRLPGGTAPAGVMLEHTTLASLLSLTLPIQAIASLSAWVDTAAQAIALLHGLEPWLTGATRATLRVTEAVAAELIIALPQLPARCALIVPCTGAADHEGRGEDPTHLLLCLERLSAQTVDDAAGRAAAAPRRILRETWNDRDRAWRTARQGGVAVQLPLPRRELRPSWTVSIVEDVPATPIGVAVAALQTTAYRASCGFDYVAELSGATVLTVADTVFVVPQDGPVLIEPSLLPDADGETADPAGAAMLGARVALQNGQLAAERARPVDTLSDRPAFLLGTAASPARYLTEIWPRMEYLFRQCEQDRLTPDAFDVLVPGGADTLVIDSLLALGILRANIRRDLAGVLFRRLLVVPPASHADRAQRGTAYDAFWVRLETLRRGGDFVSFSQARPPDRVFLTAGDGGSLLNATSLAAIARQRGFQLVSPHDADFTTLAVQLAAARIIIGESDAMAWSVLARDCAIGALLADTATQVPHALLHAAAARGHTVAVAFGSAIGVPGQPGCGFAVAPELLDALIDRLERGQTPERVRPAGLAAMAEAGR